MNNNFRQKYEEMVALYATGLTLAEVGEKFGMTRQRVQQILIMMDVPRRDMHSYPPKYRIPVATCPVCKTEFHPAHRWIRCCSSKCSHEQLKRPMSGKLLKAYEYVQQGYGYMTAVVKAGFPRSRVKGVAFRLSSKMKRYGLTAPTDVLTTCRTCKAPFVSERKSTEDGFKFQCPRCLASAEFADG